MGDTSTMRCSFCTTPASSVKKLVAGPQVAQVYICDHCIDLSYRTIHKTDEGVALAHDSGDLDPTETPSPRQMKDFLDQYVIGQDHAKEVLCVAVYNHYKRLRAGNTDGIEVEKSNILLCGPTGVGKTLLGETIARMLDVPFAIADATSLTESGYIGEDVESIVGRLLAASDGNVKRCETGIILLDEIDKKSARNSSGGGRDVSGEGVQQALLKLLEGSDIMVAPTGLKKSPNVEMVKVNTRNILFIVCGAFVGLDKIVAKAIDKDRPAVGFSSAVGRDKPKIAALLRQIEPEHLVTYGLIPELIGRLPIISALDELDEQQLVRVLTEPKNALVKQFTKMFRMDGVELEFDHEALSEIAKIAIKRKTGGRALRSVMESRLMRVQFDLPDIRKQGATKVRVHAAMITDHSPADIWFADDIRVNDNVDAQIA